MGGFVVSAVLFLLAFGDPDLADATDTIGRVKAKMESARIREYPPEIRITDEQLKQADPNQMLAVLATYTQDPEWPVRHAACLFMTRMSAIHPTTTIRQKVVRTLLDVVFDEGGHNEGPLLMEFTASDFNDDSRALIRQALEREPVNGLTIRLCGVASIRDAIPRLETLRIADARKIHASKQYYTLAWHARLARARMGVTEDIARCLEFAEGEKDETERVLQILPDIGYIRQPKAIEYLRKYLESNKRLPPTNPGMPGELYASRVMHILAKSIQGYPVEQKPAGNYTEHEIDICRRWMANRANWKIIR